MNQINKRIILFIVTDRGAFNTFLGELSVSLVTNYKLSIHVITAPTAVIDIEDRFNYQQLGIKFHFVKIPRSFNILHQISASKKIHTIIQDMNPGLIHVHFTSGCFTTLLYKRPQQKIWGTFHGLSFTVRSGFGGIVFKVIERFCFSRLDKILVLNNIDFEVIKEMYPISAYKYKCLGLGCDNSVFNPMLFNNKVNFFLKKALNIGEQRVLIYVGRFTSFKGFHLLAMAFLKLTQECPAAYKLLIIGGNDPVHGSGLNESYENDFFSHADVINIGFTKEVAKYLAIADLMIFPSSREGVPVCILESLSMGVPVITSDSRGCNELIRDGYNGYLINNSLDIEQKYSLIKEKIIHLFDNMDKYDFMKLNALKDRNIYDRKIFIEEETFGYLDHFRNYQS